MSRRVNVKPQAGRKHFLHPIPLLFEEGAVTSPALGTKGRAEGTASGDH